MTNQQEEKKSRIKGRSVAYPGFSLDDAVCAVADLRKTMGKGPYSREAIAEGLGYGKRLNGTSIRKIASLVHFGLLSREGNIYKQSVIAEHIINFIDEDEKKRALIEAVKNPTLYASLIEEYKNHALPAMLDKIIIRMGIGEKVANQAAEIFKKSLEFAGLLKDGVVYAEIGGDSDVEIKKSLPPIQEEPSLKTMANYESSPEFQNIHLPSGLIISYPKGLGYLFAIGKFGTQVASLEDAVSNEIKKNENGVSAGNEEADKI